MRSSVQCVAVCCTVLQCIAECCSVLQCIAVHCSALQCVAAYCCVLLRVAVVAMCCSVLQCVAVCCSVLKMCSFDRQSSESQRFGAVYRVRCGHYSAREGLCRMSAVCCWVHVIRGMCVRKRRAVTCVALSYWVNVFGSVRVCVWRGV